MTEPMRGWWGLPCWNALSEHQQRVLIEVGTLSWGWQPMGKCPNGAAVEITTMWDKAPGPRFYCLDCAEKHLANVVLARRIAELT